MEFSHGLGNLPSRVSVQVQSGSGSLSGYIFEAGAASQQSDTAFQHGGVLFAYSKEKVRVWSSTSGEGRIVSIRDGWGQAYLESSSGKIRIRAWQEYCPVTFDSGWFLMRSQAGKESFREVRHGLGRRPNIQVQTRYFGYVFEGFSMPQADVNKGAYGGLSFATNENSVRLWAPTSDEEEAEGAIISITPNWGSARQSVQSHLAEVRIVAFDHSCQGWINSLSWLTFLFFFFFFYFLLLA